MQKQPPRENNITDGTQRLQQLVAALLDVNEGLQTRQDRAIDQL